MDREDAGRRARFQIRDREGKFPVVQGGKGWSGVVGAGGGDGSAGFGAADALGYHQVTTAKLAAQAGGTWSRYAAGDHLKSPPGWTHEELTTVE